MCLSDGFFILISMKKPLKENKCKYCQRFEPEIKLVKPNCIKVQCCEECYNNPNACEKLKRMKLRHEETAKRRDKWQKIYKNEYRKKHWDWALLKSAKQRAKRYNLPITITISDIVVPKFCPVLGIELKQANARMNDASPTVDRINPKLGYIKGNICVMSNRANRIKSDGTMEEHKKIIAFLESLDTKKVSDTL